jgi:hypothetical protein
MDVCCIKGCEGAVFAGDCCKSHWERWKKYGSPLRYKVLQFHGVSEQERFWNWVEKTSECWLWKGAPNTTGYGQMSVVRSGKRAPMLAHRLSFEYAHGPIPNGLFVCHACDKPACVRPDHLFLGDQTVNMRDMMKKGRGRPGGDVKGRHTNHKRKLTPEAVRDMRSSKEPSSLLAKKYGVSVSTVNAIRARIYWKHLKD